MEILIVKTAGFCFGVKRAIDTAFSIAGKKKSGVFTFGPLIHNPQVINRLKEMAIAPTEVLDDRRIEALIIRTHGVPVETMRTAEAKGYEIIDATCPFVKKAQHYAKLLHDEGYQVVILGEKDHPEVKGLVSYAGPDALVLAASDDLPRLKKKVGIIVQTTQPVEALVRLSARIIEQSKEVKVYNTICNSTARRLKETEEMSRKVDVMIVVGGKNSANTTQLAHLCAAIPVPTHHIETASEMDPSWFRGVTRAGITAGASTPQWIIDEVRERILDIGGAAAHGA